MTIFRTLYASLVMACVAAAQTTAEYDTIKQSLLAIQQTSANSLTVIDSSPRPNNWRDLLIADMQKAVGAATTARNLANSSVVNSTTVPAGGDLQEAIDNAKPGDLIVLQAGATYRGNFTLPVKTGSSYITITSSKLSSLPADGQRVSPSDAPLMPKIVSPNGSAAIYALSGSHHYSFVGVQIAAPQGLYAGVQVRIGSAAETSEAALPYNIIFDRVYVHGDPVYGGKRGIELNGKAITVQNSWISGFFNNGQETQAVAAWNTPGPLNIVNNQLEAAGMSIHIGGAEPSIAGVRPSDITIIRNHMTKPLSWRAVKLVVKNLLELKAGRRVTITGNILENAWAASQTGFAIMIGPGETSRTPTLITDVLIANNIIRHAAGGVDIVGVNNSGGRASNLTIKNNLFDDIGPAWGSQVPLLLILKGPAGVRFENNTATPSVTPTSLAGVEGPAASGFVFQANIFPFGTYGIKGSGLAAGLPTLTAAFPNAVFTKNILFGTNVNPATYPPGNYFPVLASQIGWLDLAAGNFSLASVSTFKAVGVNGADPGISYADLLAATATTLKGR